MVCISGIIPNLHYGAAPIYCIETMIPYVSIRSDVLRKLEEHLPKLQNRFGITTIGIFGSVARGEDTPESDIDILVTFRPEFDKYMNFLGLHDYLESLLGRKIDLIPERSINRLLIPAVYADLISCPHTGIA